MVVTYENVKEKVTKFESTYSVLHTRMDNDYQLYVLDQYILDKWSNSITSNAPAVYADKVLQTLEAAKPLITVTTPENKKDKETAIERLAVGSFQLGDKFLRRCNISQGRNIQGSMVFYGAIRGFMILKVILVRDGKRIIPKLIPVDPRWFAWGLDGDGMAWGASTSWRDKDLIKDEYNVDISGTNDKVIDYWDRNESVIIVGNKEVRQSHKIKKPPFVFVPCGSQPLVFSTYDRYANLPHWGESIFSRSRGLYSKLNEILSIRMSLAEKSHRPGGFAKSQDGTFKIEQTPWMTGAVVPVPADFEWIPVEPPKVANDVPQFYETIARDVQMGDFAYFEHGIVSTTEPPSGKAMTLLQEGKDKVITPLLKSLAALWEDSIELICDQYERIKVTQEWRGYDSHGRLFYQEIKPTDVKPPWDLDVRFVSITPEQEVSNYAKAEMARQIGLPDTYIREKILEIQDPDEPLIDKFVEASYSFPKNQLYKMIEALMKRGKTHEAQLLMKEMAKLIEVEQTAPQLGTSEMGTPTPQLPANGQSFDNEPPLQLQSPQPQMQPQSAINERLGNLGLVRG